MRMRAPHHCRIQEEDRGRAGEGGGLAGTVGAFWPAGELKRCRQRDIRKSALARRAAAKRGKKGEGTRFGGFAKILK